MVAPCVWDVDPTSLCPSWAELTPAVQGAALSLATSVLWAATGRQFGTCEITVRPCQSKEIAERYRVYPVWWDSSTGGGGGGFYPYIQDGVWRNCGCGGACCCRPHCEIVLDGPVASVTEVLVDGIPLETDEYRVDTAQGNWRLVKTSPDCWPTCQDFNEPGDGIRTLQVTYMQGVVLPASLVTATAILACEFGKSLSGRDCALPARVAR